MKLFTLQNEAGCKVILCNYGARIHELWVPDKNGKEQDIVLGCHNIKDYTLPDFAYFGATIGPYANRIANAQFLINNKRYTLSQNDGTNCLHGGRSGFHSVLWQVDFINDRSMAFIHQTKDGENGFPGPVHVRVLYNLDDNNTFSIQYEAYAEKATHINMTQHPYFNLSGSTNQTINNHFLRIQADSILTIDSNGIPIRPLSIKGEPIFDFRQGKQIGLHIDEAHPQLKIANGYDHTYILSSKGVQDLAAEVYEPTSGIVMRLFTTEPGLQFFSGNFNTISNKGKDEKAYIPRSGFCLEPQHFPNSPNRQDFPSSLIKPGDMYQSTTRYEFDTKNA